MSRGSVLRLGIYILTTAAAWAVLSYGTTSESRENLQVGDVASRTYEVVTPNVVTDTVSWEAAQENAAAAVDRVTVPRTEIEEQVVENIEGFFASISQTVLRDGTGQPVVPPTEGSTTTSTTTTTAPPSDGDETTSTTSTTVPPEEVQVEGFLYIDADGNGEYDPELPEDAERGTVADVPLPMVTVLVQSPTRLARTESQSDGTFAVNVTDGDISVTVESSDPELPRFAVSAGALSQQITCQAGNMCQVDPVGFDPEMLGVEAVVSAISPETLVPDEAIATLAAVAREDVVRTAVGGQSHLAVVQQEAIARAQNLFLQRIYETDTEQGLTLEEAKITASEQPPLVFYTDVGERDVAAGKAAGDVVANFLLANWTFDEVATEAARAEAAAAVLEEDYRVSFDQGQVIVNEGERLTQLDIDAIGQTGGILERTQRVWGLLAVVSILSAVLALDLTRVRPEFWAKPRMVALLGILLVMAAAAVRGTVALAPASSWYVMPAVAFGLMTAVLFDARIGVLMALAVAILVAAGTRDPGLTVYSLLATMAPIGFVSSVSTRRAFRNAAVFAAMSAAVTAAATSWFFHTGPQDEALTTVGTSVAWAFGVSLAAALLGLAALQFFESTFDITTTLALLDLTDRNHEALQLLQEKAFGSFNHSLMVGTLADAAARAIGANPLLARASAYYHDLGKTELPTFFIENQFGIANPHDEMTPEESAEVIRRHVTDGVRLANRFKIPSEVAEGIVSHHGDGIMRYFYEKARERDPDVDPALFRHAGHKPRTQETAIVMLADSLEASCRAVFQNEEPTPEAIEKVVTRVIDEKVNDGQLSDSPLTLAQLTQVRKAFLGSLIGHYHQRIAYPNFPGS